MDKLFMSKGTRDRVWAGLPKEVKAGHRRRSHRGQLLHPMYVEDYEKETGVKLSAADKGFGNMIYKTFFAVLYSIEPRYY